tara:strand:+ start:2955 stop:3755 length:801 start_codon:yes stop_codon:yes gene_type:complete
VENFTEHSIGFDEYITGNRFIDICDNSEAVFCKTDYISNFREHNCKVFLTHNSDYHITENVFSYGPACQLWLAQNKDLKHPNVEGIPIGLENMILRTNSAALGGKFSSQVEGAMEKAMLINQYASLEVPKSEFTYMNFNVKTYPQEREMVWEMFKNEKWVTTTQGLSLQKFYFDLASHKFVISPRGNGVDCHRTWEALYLRTIPIVRRSTHMDEFSDLPIYYVDDWSEISYTKLNEYYEMVQSSLFDLSKMKISAWKEYIDEKLSV